jgi:predicted permease
MALGIGANTAIFSVVNAVLIRPLPFEQSGQLVQLFHTPPPESGLTVTKYAVSPANYMDWRSQNSVFERMAIYFPDFKYNLTGQGEPESVTTAAVSSDFFLTLRARPLLGRGFASGEDEAGHDRVVILSQEFWQNRFGADPKVIGKDISLNSMARTVIGVMPTRLQFPVATDPSSKVQAWVPLHWTAKDRAIRQVRNYQVIARLKPGVDTKRAQAEMNTISAQLAQQFPEENKGWGAKVIPLQEQLVEDVRPALLMLLGAVAFVLLIACANVANLMLGRILSRRTEFAMRMALGATRARLLRQALSETVLLSLAGGILGLLVAHFGIRLIIAFLSDQLPRSGEIGLDLWALGFTLVISVFTGIFAGFIPAWRLCKVDMGQGLRQGTERTATDGSGKATRNLLVVCEVALSVVLLIGAGLMIRTLSNLRRVDPGFDPHNLLTATLVIPRAKYENGQQQSNFFEQVLRRVRALPGVESAAVADQLPIAGYDSTQPFTIEGHPMAQAEQPTVVVRTVSTDFFRSLRIPLLRGRTFNDGDTANNPAVVLISQALAERFWPNQDPIGRRLTLTFSPESQRQVIGIVGDVKQEGLDAAQPAPMIYGPATQLPNYWMSLVLRTKSRPQDLSGAMVKSVHEVDAEQPVVEVMTMNDILSLSLLQRRFNMLLLAAFAGLALFLAAVGIYSVLSYAVKRRTREIGIRMALGAQIGDILRLIVIEGMKPALTGLAVGLIAAFALGRVLAGLISGVRATDMMTFVSAAALLLGVGLIASLVPAYRATRAEPMRRLREE